VPPASGMRLDHFARDCRCKHLIGGHWGLKSRAGRVPPAHCATTSFCSRAQNKGGRGASLGCKNRGPHVRLSLMSAVAPKAARRRTSPDFSCGPNSDSGAATNRATFMALACRVEEAAHSIKSRHIEAMADTRPTNKKAGGAVLVSFKRRSRSAQDSNRANYQQPEWKYAQAGNRLQSKSRQ